MPKGNSSPPETRAHFAAAYLRGLMYLLCVFVAGVLAVTAIVFFTDIAPQERTYQMVFIGIMLLAVMFASVCAARRAGSGGLLLGALIGGTYAMISYQLGAALSPEAGGLLLLGGRFVVCALTGALGGVIGVNI